MSEKGPLEKVVQARIRDVLAAMGIQSEKTWGNALQAGWPDLFCGRFWIEVKRKGGKLRATQVEWFETWVPQGVRAYVCDDVRELQDIIANPESNYKRFMPRVHPRERMESALKQFQEDR